MLDNKNRPVVEVLRQMGDLHTEQGALAEPGGELSEEEEMEEDEEEGGEEGDEEDDDDDGGGWITPSNLKQVQLESGDWTAPADVKVGCLTTDFAMQV